MATNKNVFQPHYLKSEQRWVCGFGGGMSRADAQAECDRRNKGERLHGANRRQSCHYCGCPATGQDIFGAPVCDDCR